YLLYICEISYRSLPQKDRDAAAAGRGAGEADTHGRRAVGPDLARPEDRDAVAVRRDLEAMEPRRFRQADLRLHDLAHGRGLAEEADRDPDCRAGIVGLVDQLLPAGAVGLRQPPREGGMSRRVR